MGEIAQDTRNITKNVLKTEYSLLGRAAFLMGKSLGAFIWHYFMKGLAIEDPELAEKLKRCRVNRYITNTMVVLVGLLSVTQTTLGKQDRQRRCRSMLRPCMRQTVARCVRAQRYFQFKLSAA